MAETKIEWTHRKNPVTGHVVPGFTFNAWIGCTKVSPACDHCYAERDAAGRRKWVTWGPEAGGGTRRVTSEAYWKQPERWARQARPGDRPLVFTCSLADVFEEWAGPMLSSDDRVLRHDPRRGGGSNGWVGAEPVAEAVPDGPGVPRRVTMDAAREALFLLMARTAHALDWLVLTKRPRVMARLWPSLCTAYGVHLGALAGTDSRYGKAWEFFRKWGMPGNVWAGVTAEGQEWWDNRVPVLKTVRAARRFVSVEPQVGPVLMMTAEYGTWKTDINNPARPDPFGGYPGSPGIHWVISGGESGGGARAANPDWYRSLRDQCQRVGTPFFFKQHGEIVDEQNAPPGSERAARIELPLAGTAVTMDKHPPATHGRRVGKAAAGRLLDGREWSEIPESLLA